MADGSLTVEQRRALAALALFAAPVPVAALSRKGFDLFWSLLESRHVHMTPAGYVLSDKGRAYLTTHA